MEYTWRESLTSSRTSLISFCIQCVSQFSASGEIQLNTNETSPVVYGDIIQLTSLLQNLIGNAIKFIQKQPKVHISSKTEENWAVFTIQDDGIGMEAKDTDKIFAVFHRLHSKSEYPGTGIGLAP